MTTNPLTLNPSKTEFMLIGPPQQLSKIHFSSLSLPPAQPIPCSSARNLGFVFDSSLSFSQKISKLSSSCHYHIRDLRRIRNSLATKEQPPSPPPLSIPVSTTATHSITLFLHSNFTVSNSYKLNYAEQFLELRWLKIKQRIQYKIIYITHNLLHSATPFSLYCLLNIQLTRPTRSSNCLCLAHPKLSSRLKFSDRSFRNAAHSLWNKLPTTVSSPQ